MSKKNSKDIKKYFFSLIFTKVDRLDMEEEIVDFYFPITKNSMQKHQQFYPTLGGVMDPIANFFENKDGLNCMATIYGYERHLTSSYDDKFEEGQELWFTIIELLLSFVRTMQKTHEFELFAYGMASNEGEFGWFSYPNNITIPTEEIYEKFPREYITI